ncbi:MAG: hypothetical protein RMJ07_00575 [Nitrososphaerota archaeon]|nr:hypothetical protein [Candidatus Bathyarchaeota archaeon]MDW8048167.1 hypothetical protein [Nitrososphaerota archaeon]
MMAENMRDKKLVRIPSNLVDKLKEMAQRRGRPFHLYLVSILQNVMELHEKGLPFEEAVKDVEAMRVLKEAGAVLVPEDFLEYALASAGKEGLGVADKIWYHAGRWCGLYIKCQFSDPLLALLHTLRAVAGGLCDVQIRRGSGTYEIRCVSTTLSKDRMTLISCFIEGAVKPLGYEIIGRECMEGILRLSISKM